MNSNSKLSSTIVICREETPNGIEIKPMAVEVTTELLTNLQYRSRYNPTLQYYLTSKSFWLHEISRNAITEKIKKQESNDYIQKI